MKPIKLIFIVVGILILGLVVGRLTAPGSGGDDAAEVVAGSDVSTDYTCSMHPQIRQPNPGKCPICAMDLIPVAQAGADDVGPREVSLSEYAKALARIQTTEVERRIPEVEVRLFGRVQTDESRIRSITARFPARIERLYVNFTGVRVKEGDHLAEIYSPELLTAQAELLSARRFNDPRATRSSREKLELWGLSESAIAAIEAKGEPADRMDIDSPLGGFVTEKMVNDGDYVDTGAQLFTITDLSAVWVVLDAYEMDMPWLRFGQSVTFTADALPGRTFEGLVAFIPPVLDLETRTFKVRVNVANPDFALRPGMFVTGIVHARVAGEGMVIDPSLEGKWISPMHPEIVKDSPGECDVCGMDLVPASELGYATSVEAETPILVPASAVLQTGERAVVYVEVPDRERPTYEGREIVLGPRAGDQYLVMSGLDVGQRVVTNGAFKLDSALQLLAKPSMMSADDAGESEDGGGGGDFVEVPSEHLTAVLPGYLTLASALADDNLEGSKAAVRAMMEVAGHEGALADLLHVMLDGDSLDAIRRPHFELLSNSVIKALHDQPDAVEGELLLMYCPMVYDDRGAHWLQSAEPLANPYFGEAMLQCGEVEPFGEHDH